LIGITCLFISSKIEEIYPPKVSEFAYVTDGACTEDDIQTKELVILKSLKWDLVPMTVNGWLCVYMQLFSSLDKENSDIKKTLNLVSGDESSSTEDEDFEKEVLSENNTRKERKLTHSSPSEPKLVSKINNYNNNKDFMVPGYPSQFFAQVAHLLDLSILDIGSLLYPYSIMAAAALYHFTNENIVFQCTGLKLPQIRECVVWMTPFALAIRDEGFENPKLFKSSDDRESFINIQCHTADLELLEKAQAKQQDRVEVTCISSSPSVTASKASILTPPRSASKGELY
jgi:cyclin E